MTLRQEQSAFAADVVKLLLFVQASGVEVTFGEALRTEEQQKLYFSQGKSKTMNSMHLKKCAIDLNFFKDGQLLQTREQIKPFGEFWEGLGEKNRWGGSWRGQVEAKRSNFVDAPHFERAV